MDLALPEAEVRSLLDPVFDASIEPALEAHVEPAGCGTLFARHPDLWERLLAQFTEFVCTDSARYADLRAEWTSLRERGAEVAVTALTAALAAEVGVASTVIAPLVVWLVLGALRMGSGAFCEMRHA